MADLLQENKQELKQYRNAQFIDKILLMMKEYPQYARWSENGEEFWFYNTHQIQAKILPVYFRTANLTSFIRQFNIYNFKRFQSKDGKSIGIRHPLFQKNNEHNFYKIKRRNLYKKEVEVNVSEHSSLQLLQKQICFSKETKDIVKIAMQYHRVTLNSLQKIKDNFNVVSRCYKPKFIAGALKNVVQHLFNVDFPDLNTQIQESRSIQKFLKESFCKDFEENLSINTLMNIEQKLISNDSHFVPNQQSCSLFRNFRDGTSLSQGEQHNGSYHEDSQEQLQIEPQIQEPKAEKQQCGNEQENRKIKQNEKEKESEKKRGEK